MAKNSAVNLDITNNADGYDITGGTTPRKLTLSGADITLTGSGSNTFTYPSASDTLVGRDSTDTLTNKTIDTASNTITVVATDVSDFDTEVSNNSDVVTNSLKTGVTTEISNVVEDTSPQLGGDLDLNSKGFTRELTAASGNSFVEGELGFFASGGVTKADASAESTAKGLLVMATETISATTTGSFFIVGTFTTTGLTAGAEFYISETAGEFTSTKPTTSGTIVRIIGYAISTTELIFQPDNTYVEN